MMPGGESATKGCGITRKTDCLRRWSAKHCFFLRAVRRSNRSTFLPLSIRSLTFRLIAAGELSLCRTKGLLRRTIHITCLLPLPRQGKFMRRLKLKFPSDGGMARRAGHGLMLLGVAFFAGVSYQFTVTM